MDGTTTSIPMFVADFFLPDASDLQPLGLAAEDVNPSALALVPSNACAEISIGCSRCERSAGSAITWTVRSLAIVDQLSGMLQLVYETPFHGDGPCSITLDESGQQVSLQTSGEARSRYFRCWKTVASERL